MIILPSIFTCLLFIALISPRPGAAAPIAIDGVYTSCATLVNFEPCNDTNACTTDDVCVEEKCVGTVRNCDDGNFCTVDYCDLGECLHDSVVLIGVRCDNQDPCDTRDICSEGGICIGESLCDDGNQCTLDSCVEGECNHVVDVEAPCEDGNECTGPDYCDSEGVCIFGPSNCG